MAVKVEALLAIEDGLASNLTSLWGSYALQIRKQVESAVADQDWDRAYDVAKQLSVEPIMDAMLPHVRYAAYAALFYGASRLTDDLKSSVIARGGFDKQIGQAVSMFRKIIEQNMVEQIRDKLIADISAAEDEATVRKAERVVRPFVSFADTGNAMLQLTASLHTSRLSAYGFTAEAEVLGVDEYAVSEQLDSRICPVCYEMHGRTFLVVDARRALDVILAADAPDDLRELQPWPSQTAANVAELKKMTSAELVGRNWHIPPYHPLCRGVLVHVGKVPRLTDLPSVQAAMQQGDPSLLALASTFTFYGIKTTEEAIDVWNRLVGLDVESVLSALTGKTPMALADALADGTAGVFGVDGAKDLLTISFEEAVFGARAPVKVSMKYMPYKSEIELVTLTGGPDLLDVLKTKALESWLQLWKRLSVRYVSMDPAISSEIRAVIAEYLAQNPL